MKAVWYWSRRSLRARWRSYAGVAVLLAMLGGLTLASVAGARRTASAYTRFRQMGNAMDLQVNSGDFETRNPEVARQMPGVTDTASYVAFLAGAVLPGGDPDMNFTAEVGGSRDGLYFTRDRFAVTAGRMPDPTRPAEIAVNQRMAGAYGVEVGQHFDLGRLRSCPGGRALLRVAASARRSPRRHRGRHRAVRRRGGPGRHRPHPPPAPHACLHRPGAGMGVVHVDGGQGRRRRRRSAAVQAGLHRRR